MQIYNDSLILSAPAFLLYCTCTTIFLANPFWSIFKIKETEIHLLLRIYQWLWGDVGVITTGVYCLTESWRSFTLHWAGLYYTAPAGHCCCWSLVPEVAPDTSHRSGLGLTPPHTSQPHLIMLGSSLTSITSYLRYISQIRLGSSLISYLITSSQ